MEDWLVSKETFSIGFENDFHAYYLTQLTLQIIPMSWNPAQTMFSFKKNSQS
jgi:hypothetical protein